MKDNITTKEAVNAMCAIERSIGYKRAVGDFSPVIVCAKDMANLLVKLKKTHVLTTKAEVEISEIINRLEVLFSELLEKINSI